MKIKYSDRLFENMGFYTDIVNNGLHIESDGASKDGWTLMDITGKQSNIDNIIKKYGLEIICKPTEVELSSFSIK